MPMMHCPASFQRDDLPSTWLRWVGLCLPLCFLTSLALADVVELEGAESHGLVPVVKVYERMATRDYEFELFFRASSTNIAGLRYRWLKVPDALGAKFQVVDAKGTVVQLPKGADGTNLPPSTAAVMDLVDTVRPREYRGYIWLHFSRFGREWVCIEDLKSKFGFDIHKPLTLRVLPMLYQKRTQEELADLVCFSPIVVSLPGFGNASSETRNERAREAAPATQQSSGTEGEDRTGGGRGH